MANDELDRQTVRAVQRLTVSIAEMLTERIHPAGICFALAQALGSVIDTAPQDLQRRLLEGVIDELHTRLGRLKERENG